MHDIDFDDIAHVVLLILCIIFGNLSRDRKAEIRELKAQVVDAYEEGFYDALDEVEDKYGICSSLMPDFSDYDG